jgi:AcrR family transcriptional regulator
MSSGISKRRKSAAKESSSIYQDRRRALMEAAAATFREQGFDGASLNDIAQRAGLDRASVYYYVESKEDLYRDVVEESVRKNVEQVENIRRGSGNGAEKLAEAVRTLMESYAENYPYLYIFVAEDFGRRGPERRQGRSAKKSDQTRDWRAELSSLGDAYHTEVREIVTQGFTDGSIQSKLSAGLVAHGVIGMVSWSHRWFKPDGATSAAQIAEGFADIVLSGLHPAD